jgi:hypothetical protein
VETQSGGQRGAAIESSLVNVCCKRGAPTTSVGRWLIRAYPRIALYEETTPK